MMFLGIVFFTLGVQAIYFPTIDNNSSLKRDIRGCAPSNEECPDPFNSNELCDCYSSSHSDNVDVIVAQHEDVGDINTYRIGNTLYIEIQLDYDCYMSEYHIFAGEIGDLPDNLSPGRFPYKSENSATTKLIKIENVSFEELVVAVHLVVTCTTSNERWNAETAWGDGINADHDNWAMYFYPKLERRCIELNELEAVPTNVTLRTPSQQNPHSYWGVKFMEFPGTNNVPFLKYYQLDTEYPAWCSDCWIFITSGVNDLQPYSTLDPTPCFDGLHEVEENWRLMNALINQEWWKNITDHNIKQRYLWGLSDISEGVPRHCGHNPIPLTEEQLSQLHDYRLRSGDRILLLLKSAKCTQGIAVEYPWVGCPFQEHLDQYDDNSINTYQYIQDSTNSQGSRIQEHMDVSDPEKTESIIMQKQTSNANIILNFNDSYILPIVIGIVVIIL